MTGTAKHSGSGRRNAARMAESLGLAVAAMSATVAAVAATVVPVPVSTVPPAVDLTADSTAFVLCGTTCPTPDATYVDIVKNQYVAPTHPGLDIDYVPVTAPQEFWPITGIFRLLGVVFGDPRVFGPGGPAWPDEPLWKLSGLFDLTANRSLAGGVTALQTAIADHDGENLVIYGLSQGAGITNVVKKQLAEQYPVGTAAPSIDFVLSADPNTPNGGLMSRFPGLYIPVLDMLFNGAAATDTPFKTTVILRQYDGFSDFPLYPLNLLADLNAVMGILYLHANPFDVSLPATDPQTSPAYRGTHGDTDYYVFDTPDLPLFGPLRMLGVPEKLIDVIEPFFHVLVEQGYDRTIPVWEPTQARLIPPRNPQTVPDLVNAIDEGIDKARALIGLPALGRTPTNVPPAVPPAGAVQTEAVGERHPMQTTGVAVGSVDLAVTSGQVSGNTQPSTREMTGTADAGEPSIPVTTTSRAARPHPGPRDSVDATERTRNLPHRGQRPAAGAKTAGPAGSPARGTGGSH